MAISYGSVHPVNLNGKDAKLPRANTISSPIMCSELGFEYPFCGMSEVIWDEFNNLSDKTLKQLPLSKARVLPYQWASVVDLVGKGFNQQGMQSLMSRPMLMLWSMLLECCPVQTSRWCMVRRQLF